MDGQDGQDKAIKDFKAEFQIFNPYPVNPVHPC
jgi:hypothetical protein